MHRSKSYFSANSTALSLTLKVTQLNDLFLIFLNEKSILYQFNINFIVNIYNFISVLPLFYCNGNKKNSKMPQSCNYLFIMSAKYIKTKYKIRIWQLDVKQHLPCSLHPNLSARRSHPECFHQATRKKKYERNQINKMLNHSQGQTVQKTLPLTASLGLFNHPSFPFTKHHTLTS